MLMRRRREHTPGAEEVRKVDDDGAGDLVWRAVLVRYA